MRLSPSIVTAAAADTNPVTLEEVKKFCRVEDTNEDDEELTSFLATAFDWLQPPAGGLRVSIAEHTLRLDLPCWPTCLLELPAGPVQSIASVKYFDQSNVEQTLSSSFYFLDNDALVWMDTFSPPALYARPSAVKISYVAGYDDVDSVPNGIKLAIKQCVKHWYDNRDAVQAVGAMNMMPLGIDDLIANYRVR